MESDYLETTFISYLVARPSRDVIVAGHQQTTQDWWANRRSQFECSVSQVVIDEASAGDSAEVQKRIAIISGLLTLEVTEDAEALTQAIVLPASFRRTLFLTPLMLLWQRLTALTIC
jgi:hypothetical protein